MSNETGGSIRVPSAFNFLYGIRPSHGRLPYARMANSMEGQETVHSVVGPIAHSAAGMFFYSEKPQNQKRKEILIWVRSETVHDCCPCRGTLDI